MMADLPTEPLPRRMSLQVGSLLLLERCISVRSVHNLLFHGGRHLLFVFRSLPEIRVYLLRLMTRR